jgi:cytochrome P450
MSGCPFKNLLDPMTYAQGMPYEELARMRKDSTLQYMDDPITGVPYWAVLGIEEMDFVSKNPKLFSSAARTAFPMEYDQGMVDMVHSHMFINMDPPDHIKFRKIVRRAFTSSAVEACEPMFRQHAKNIVDAVAKRGECEFLVEVAAELPLFAILDLLGVDHADRKQFFEWTNTMIFADDPDMATSVDDGIAASVEVLTYALKLVENHKSNPGNIILTSLLDASIDGEALSEAEFQFFFILLLVGGNESTRTVIAQGMRLLMEHPDQLQYLVENPDKIKDAVEEILRYNTAFIAMRRTATEDVEVAGKTIKAGDKVVLHYHSASHDERVFGDDALTFDVRRMERMPDLAKQHRAFGYGQHFCIGTHLARLELKVMFEEIIPRLRNPKFAEDPKYVKSFFVNAIKEMKITFDPEV